jgi:hypothetical protein
MGARKKAERIKLQKCGRRVNSGRVSLCTCPIIHIRTPCCFLGIQLRIQINDYDHYWRII